MASNLIPLRSLPPGRFALLVELKGQRAFRRRLLELGLLPGTTVRLLRRSDVHNLVEIVVRGCHLSLRHSEAGQILVDLQDE